jgi:molybdopterin-guanine dinucleotide biosynthesis adapter protein
MFVIGIAGYSGSGKTTLVERLIPALISRGQRVAVIKHAHHAFDVDQPGKDSYRHRAAGAVQVLVSSAKRWALMTELSGAAEPTLAEHLAQLSPCDIVLVEGYKREAIPKIEVQRVAAATPALHTDDPHVIAIATDTPLATALPQLDLADAEAIASFILSQARAARA